MRGISPLSSSPLLVVAFFYLQPLVLGGQTLPQDSCSLALKAPLPPVGPSGTGGPSSVGSLSTLTTPL